MFDEHYTSPVHDYPLAIKRRGTNMAARGSDYEL